MSSQFKGGDTRKITLKIGNSFVISMVGVEVLCASIQISEYLYVHCKCWDGHYLTFPVTMMDGDRTGQNRREM